MDDELSRPSIELAQRVLREVCWDERIEGEIFEPGPGAVTERLYKLADVANLLRGMPSFTVPFGVLSQWVGETLGDAELAERIGAAARTCQDEVAHESEQSAEATAPAESAGAENRGETDERRREYPEERLRRRVSEFLSRRIDQCREVLGLTVQTAECPARGHEESA